ncbi:MAG: antitoxin VapB family protein, partial [Spirochaetales bacterium]|nr:antitoxin VapB family protein [Spirochaetales bacterium]
AVKTITIDMEAYNILKTYKKENESFSQVIKRILKKKKSASYLYNNISKINVSDETLEIVDSLIQDRNNSYPDSPVINLW